MANINLSMAQQVAQAARHSHIQSFGRPPKSVHVTLSEETLVISLHGALSKAEKALAQSPNGWAQVQEFHRQLFLNALDSLKEEICRITGVGIREAAVEIEAGTGAVTYAFASGTMVQVFQLAGVISPSAWNAPDAQERT